jgi:hypothetical protein
VKRPQVVEEVIKKANKHSNKLLRKLNERIEKILVQEFPGKQSAQHGLLGWIQRNVGVALIANYLAFFKALGPDIGDQMTQAIANEIDETCRVMLERNAESVQAMKEAFDAQILTGGEPVAGDPHQLDLRGEREPGPQSSSLLGPEDQNPVAGGGQ